MMVNRTEKKPIDQIQWIATQIIFGLLSRIFYTIQIIDFDLYFIVYEKVDNFM